MNLTVGILCLNHVEIEAQDRTGEGTDRSAGSAATFVDEEAEAERL